MKKGDIGWREYCAYGAAKSRCTNPRVNNYCRYGGRGIEFRFRNFAEFWLCVGSIEGYDFALIEETK